MKRRTSKQPTVRANRKCRACPHRIRLAAIVALLQLAGSDGIGIERPSEFTGAFDKVVAERLMKTPSIPEAAAALGHRPKDVLAAVMRLLA